ncbi:hypothetical protein U9M48_009275 [Paspalum notatum var. saurae]|uniref:Uncharacterized protein n=1 Tax=Paspalum notatum var. saurae TaxID=547442 RepID=A0AAQ3SRB3_PASNO
MRAAGGHQASDSNRHSPIHGTVHVMNQLRYNGGRTPFADISNTTIGGLVPPETGLHALHSFLGDVPLVEYEELVMYEELRTSESPLVAYGVPHHQAPPSSLNSRILAGRSSSMNISE